MPEHTPGPWRVGTGNEIGPRQRERTRISRESDGTGIAFLIRQGMPSDDANARLIAAAPSLLQLVESRLVCREGCGHLWCDAARGVLAKVAGR